MLRLENGRREVVCFGLKAGEPVMQCAFVKHAENPPPCLYLLSTYAGSVISRHALFRYHTHAFFWIARFVAQYHDLVYL